MASTMNIKCAFGESFSIISLNSILDIELNPSYPWLLMLAMSNHNFSKVCFIALAMAYSVILIKGVKRRMF